ncbi:hypothetical protein GE09DRAFT_1118147 [Coniochaeta sp. 2T2.1]|nr:hypothetical protein GE09DRAFT_1118147 [Coniochaeta sp. 2T2.1]
MSRALDSGCRVPGCWPHAITAGLETPACVAMSLSAWLVRLAMLVAIAMAENRYCESSRSRNETSKVLRIHDEMFSFQLPVGTRITRSLMEASKVPQCRNEQRALA